MFDAGREVVLVEDKIATHRIQLFHCNPTGLQVAICKVDFARVDFGRREDDGKKNALLLMSQHGPIAAQEIYHPIHSSADLRSRVLDCFAPASLRITGTIGLDLEAEMVEVVARQ